MSTILEELVNSKEHLQELSRRLAISPLKDDHGRQLKIKIARVVNVAEAATRIRLCAICGDIAKQVVMNDEGRFELAVNCVGRPHRWVDEDDWRGIFSAIGARADILPNPVDHGLVILMKSSKDLTENQCREAIAAAQAFGDTLGVQWPPPKTEQQI